MSGIHATDFVVREDGNERPIVSFDAFGGSAPAPADGNKEPESPVAKALRISCKGLYLKRQRLGL